MCDFYDVTPPERIAKINSFYEHVYHIWYDCLNIQNPCPVGDKTDIKKGG